MIDEGPSTSYGSPAPVAAILRLDHVQLAMPAGGERLARWFYGELLGLVEVAKPEGLAGRGGCWFGGPVQVHLGVEEPFRPAQKAHPAFIAADLDALASRLAGAGLDVREDYMLPGLRRFYGTDPFGNRIEFISNSARAE